MTGAADRPALSDAETPLVRWRTQPLIVAFQRNRNGGMTLRAATSVGIAEADVLAYAAGTTTRHPVRVTTAAGDLVLDLVALSAGQPGLPLRDGVGWALMARRSSSLASTLAAGWPQEHLREGWRYLAAGISGPEYRMLSDAGALPDAETLRSLALLRGMALPVTGGTE